MLDPSIVRDMVYAVPSTIVLRKNALRVVSERENNSDAAQLKAVLAHLTDPDVRARLNALIALGNFPASPDVAPILAGLGAVNRERGDLAAAERYEREALAVIEKTRPGSVEHAECSVTACSPLHQRCTRHR